MDEIQRELKAYIEDYAPEAAKEKLLSVLPKGPEDLEFVLGILIEQSRTNWMMFDTLVEYARRLRRPAEHGELGEPPDNFKHWCIGVAANDIKRPRRRGRPRNHLRDMYICYAIDAYRRRARDGEPISHAEVCARVAEVVELDDSVVAKIWRRAKRQQ